MEVLSAKFLSNIQFLVHHYHRRNTNRLIRATRLNTPQIFSSSLCLITLQTTLHALAWFPQQEVTMQL